VEISERSVTANEKASPDHQANAHKHDFELVDDEFCKPCHCEIVSHLIRISPVFSRSQGSLCPQKVFATQPFTSTNDLRQQILNFIAYFNRTLAKPFKWKEEWYPEVA